MSPMNTVNNEILGHVNKIAFKNDVFRRSGLGMTLSKGVQNIHDLKGLLVEVKWFNEFSKKNDPHKERDFGTIKWNGEKVFWKIDYYDQELKCWCDPLSKKCRRVLTVLLANEY